MLKLTLTLAFLGVALAGVPWVAQPRPEPGWKHMHEAFLNQTHKHAADIKVVFLGDSITAGWAHNGKKIWDAHYAPRHAYNYGIGGDRTEHVLWRVENGEFDHVKAKLVVLKIGTNNLHDNKAEDIAKGIHAILEALYRKMPDAKILLLSVLPRQPERVDTIVHNINKLQARFADNHRVHYLDLAVHFEISLGHEHAELFLPDHVHLSEKGYEMWYKVMEPTFKKLIA